MNETRTIGTYISFIYAYILLPFEKIYYDVCCSFDQVNTIVQCLPNNELGIRSNTGILTIESEAILMDRSTEDI